MIYQSHVLQFFPFCLPANQPLTYRKTIGCALCQWLSQVNHTCEGLNVEELRVDFVCRVIDHSISNLVLKESKTIIKKTFKLQSLVFYGYLRY